MQSFASYENNGHLKEEHLKYNTQIQFSIDSANFNYLYSFDWGIVLANGKIKKNYPTFRKSRYMCFVLYSHAADFI